MIKASNINKLYGELQVLKKVDLFNRGHQYKVIDLDNSFPDFLLKNYRTYKDFIL